MPTATEAVIDTVTLEATSASGGKFYIVDLVEARGGYLVNFRYGANGDTPRTGTKTKTPVPRAKAESIMATVIKEKENGDSHYRRVAANGAPAMVEPAATATPGACLPCRLLDDVDETRIMDLVKDPSWFVQIKYDGDRVQLHYNGIALTLYSGRSAKRRACPANIAEAFQSLFAADGLNVIDGELVGDTLWVFDLMFFGGVDLRSRPYRDRFSILSTLASVIGTTGAIRLVESRTDANPKAQLIVDAKEKLHAEGVVFINANAPYRPGKTTGDNLRWKFKASASAIVAKQNEKRSVALQLADGADLGDVSIPVNREIPPVGAVIECEYLYAGAGGHLVQAVYKGLRTDVERESCVRSQLKFKDGIDPLKK